MSFSGIQEGDQSSLLRPRLDAFPTTPSKSTIRRPFFPAPFRVTDYRGSTTITETPRKRRRVTYSSEVHTFASPANDLSTHRMEATMRLQNCWWSLVEKYSTPLDEDDEVDVFTGRVVRDRGIVRRMEKTYEIGDLLMGNYLGDGDDTEGSEEWSSARPRPRPHVRPDGRDRQGSPLEGEGNTSEDEVALSEDLSEDELGLWGEASGLDYQYRIVPPFSAQLDSEDERDLHEFEEAEKALRARFGPQHFEDESTDDEFLSDDQTVEGEYGEEGMWESSDSSGDEFASFDLGEGSVVRMLYSSGVASPFSVCLLASLVERDAPSTTLVL
ncbi:hypothetical protein CALVIDRAFT_164877 [Calocera viscosa TUFC12733]|uniref:Uncharacterized protein n=1 Tax=Calocera viscosa (strain TUFC12733) TaxID=1330018 RepID=A0A167LF16_CALVF|nr:hypothetical protein CALVIDRAFT_164877 [Calocera viscosa TUFC12733]